MHRTTLTPSDFLRLRHPIHLCGMDAITGMAYEVAKWEDRLFHHEIVLWRALRETRFSFPHADCIEPQLSSDGHMLAFICRVGDVSRLQIYNAETRKLEEIDKYNDVVEAVWRPDGQALCMICGHAESRMLLYFVQSGEEVLLRRGSGLMRRAVFSDDGRKIAYISAADGMKIRCIDVVSKESVLLSNDVFQPVKLSRPQFTADGTRVLCLGSSTAEESEQHRLFCLHADGSGEIELKHTGDIPQEVMPLYADGESLPNASCYMARCENDSFRVIGARNGNTGIYNVQLSAGNAAEWTCIFESRCCISGISRGGALISTTYWPFEVYTLMDGSTPVRLSSENVWVERKELCHVTCLHMAGDAENGWGVFPMKKSEKCPAVLLLHGGPACYFSGGFSLEQQLLAGAGHAVVFGDPHGSSGYGAAYAESRLAFDGTAEHEVMALLNDAISGSYGIDPQRLAVIGGSYGGFLSAWLISHHKDLKAACVLRALLGGEGMRALAGFDEDEMQRGARDVRIPVLVMHGEDDPICPLRYAEEYYEALGTGEKRFVSFPGAKHSVGELNAADAERFYLEILSWLRRYL